MLNCSMHGFASLVKEYKILNLAKGDSYNCSKTFYLLLQYCSFIQLGSVLGRERLHEDTA